MLSIYLNDSTIYLYLNLYLYYIYLFMNLVISISIYSFIDSLICLLCLSKKRTPSPSPRPARITARLKCSELRRVRQAILGTNPRAPGGHGRHGRDGKIQKSHGFYAFDGESSPYFCVKKCVLPIISPYFDIFWGKMIRMYVLIDCG